MSDYNRFQRVGSVSNAQVGVDFEVVAQRVLRSQGVEVQPNFAIPVGVSAAKKSHRFDLGSRNPPVIVECKSHTWTATGNVPSAKLTIWNEVMLYFTAAPDDFRKILFVLKDTRARGGETLAEYYVRTYSHLIPERVEVWEFDSEDEKIVVLTKAHN